MGNVVNVGNEKMKEGPSQRAECEMGHDWEDWRRLGGLQALQRLQEGICVVLQNWLNIASAQYPFFLFSCFMLFFFIPFFIVSPSYSLLLIYTLRLCTSNIHIYSNSSRRRIRISRSGIRREKKEQKRKK